MIDSRGCPKAGNGQLGEIVVELKRTNGFTSRVPLAYYSQTKSTLFTGQARELMAQPGIWV